MVFIQYQLFIPLSGKEKNDLMAQLALKKSIVKLKKWCQLKQSREASSSYYEGGHWQHFVTLCFKWPKKEA